MSTTSKFQIWVWNHGIFFSTGRSAQSLSKSIHTELLFYQLSKAALECDFQGQGHVRASQLLSHTQDKGQKYAEDLPQSPKDNK